MSSNQRVAGESSGKKQPKLTSFFGKRTSAASSSASKPEPKRSREPIDLTEDEPPAKRPVKQAQHASADSPGSSSVQPARQSDAASHGQPAPVPTPAPQPATNSVHGTLAAAVAKGQAQPRRRPRQSGGLSEAEKSARRAKAQRKLAQEAPRRGREAQKPQPMTPLEKQVKH